MAGSRGGGDNPICGKWALVTGGSRGIGRAIAERLAAEGANIALHYRSSAESAEEVARVCRELGSQVALFQSDFAEPDGAETLGKAVYSEGFPIEILVNNAGTAATQPFWAFDPETWDRVQRVNLASVRDLIQVLLPPMVKNRWGRIINISSILASWGGRGSTAYSASKAGLEALSRALALETAQRNITVNAIAPGLVETEMTDTLGEEIRENVIERIPLHRAAVPAEVAEAVVFLCRCGYVTGEIVNVDGGLRHAF
jgi:3-oxoacyl-[acyl-carrier protein] reductase